MTRNGITNVPNRLTNVPASRIQIGRGSARRFSRRDGISGVYRLNWDRMAEGSATWARARRRRHSGAYAEEAQRSTGRRDQARWSQFNLYTPLGLCDLRKSGEEPS